MITTICYGHKEEWETAEEAIKQFVIFASGSEGSERDRYYKILLELYHGYTLCTDEED